MDLQMPDMIESGENAPATESDRARLAGASHAMLKLHKALLDAEQAQHERAFGRIEDRYQLLHLVVNDPLFAWLRLLSALIVQIDEALAEKEPMSAEDARHLEQEVRALLQPDESGGDFQRNYHRAMQASPEVVMLHGNVMRVLAK
jgi:hypothetical protein